MKKVALFGVLMLFVAVLSACGGSGENTSTASHDKAKTADQKKTKKASKSDVKEFIRTCLMIEGDIADISDDINSNSSDYLKEDVKHLKQDSSPLVNKIPNVEGANKIKYIEQDRTKKALEAADDYKNGEKTSAKKKAKQIFVDTDSDESTKLQKKIMKKYGFKMNDFNLSRQ